MIDHPTLVNNLAKPGEDIRTSLSSTHCHVWHMITGAVGEVGELSDAIKKWVIYGKDLDLDHVVEEMGDIEFYLEGLRQGLGVTREEVLEDNINKLTKRYGEKYSDQAAINRADKE